MKSTLIDSDNRHFSEQGPWRHLFDVRPMAAIVALAMPVAIAMAIFPTPWWSGISSQGARQISGIVAQVLTTGVALSFAAFVVVVQLVVGHSPRVLLLYISLVRGMLLYLMLATQAGGLLLLLMTQEQTSILMSRVAIADAALTVSLVPITTLLLLSSLSPSCIITGLTSGIESKLARGRMNPRRLAHAAQQIDGLASYAHRCSGDGNLDGYRMSVEKLVDVALMVAMSPPQIAPNRSECEWVSLPFVARWLVMAGDLAPNLSMATTASNIASVRLEDARTMTRTGTCGLGIMALERAIAVEFQLGASGNRSFALEGVLPLHLSVLQADTFAKKDEHRGFLPSPSPSHLPHIAEAIVMAWMVAATYSYAQDLHAITWRSVIVLHQAAILFADRPGLSRAALDARRSLGIIRKAVVGAPDHPLAAWVTRTLRAPEEEFDEEAKTFTSELFPELLIDSQPRMPTGTNSSAQL